MRNAAALSIAFYSTAIPRKHWAYRYFTEQCYRSADGKPVYRCHLPDDKKKEKCNAELVFSNVGSLKQHLQQLKHKAIWDAHTAGGSAAASSSSSSITGVKRTAYDMFGAAAGTGIQTATHGASAAAASSPIARVITDVEETESMHSASTLVSAVPSGSLPASSRRSAPSQEQKITTLLDSSLDPLTCILMALVMNCLPLSLIDDPYFRQAIDRVAETAKAGHCVQLVARKTLRKMLLRKHQVLKGELVTYLKKLRGPVSFVLDGWTDVNHNKVTNVMLVAKGRAFYWDSVINKTERNTAVWLSAALLPMLHDIEMMGIPVVSYVADNEEVMTKTHRLLKPEFGALLRIPCAAHTIQLIVKKILTDEPFKGLINEYIEMLNLFSSTKALRLALEAGQPSSNTARRLIRPCETRWSYTLLSIDRSVKLRHYIDQALPGRSKPSLFWDQLDEIADILRPFAEATDVLQRDNAVLWDVAEQYALLTKHATEIGKTHPNISTIVHRCIDAEWTSHHTHTAATAACGFLAKKEKNDSMKLISTPAEKLKAQQFIVEWGEKYLDHYQPCPFGDQNISEVLDAQIVHFINGSGPFQTIPFDKRLITHGVLGAWKSMLDFVPELANVAVALFSICASEACVERSFSLKDRIHNKTRNRSTQELVEAQMFIKSNAPLFKSKTLPCILPPDPVLEIPVEPAAEHSEPIVLKYFVDVPAQPAPTPAASASAAPAASEVDAAVAATMIGMMDDGSADSHELEDTELEKEAAPAAAIATQDEEDAYLKAFVLQHNIKPNRRNVVTLVVDLDNTLSREVEAHIPRIKTQMPVLKKRLSAWAVHFHPK